MLTKEQQNLISTIESNIYGNYSEAFKVKITQNQNDPNKFSLTFKRLYEHTNSSFWEPWKNKVSLSEITEAIQRYKIIDKESRIFYDETKTPVENKIRTIEFTRKMQEKKLASIST